MGFKPHPPLGPLLIGYDPFRDLPEDHLAWFVDSVVDSCVPLGTKDGPGQPGYEVRMSTKVILYGLSTGIRSTRKLAQNCRESLPFLLLVRDDRPSYRTLCTVRSQNRELIETVWVSMLQMAGECGIKCVGKIAVDSTKIRADVSRDSVVARKDMDEVLAVFREMLREAEAMDAKEDEEGQAVCTQTSVPVSRMREVIRRTKTKKPEKMIPTPGLSKNIEKGIQTLEAAQKANLSQVSLTDPDARMMPIGSSKRVSMGHSFEAAADSGLLVAGQTHNGSTDNDRLGILLAEARKTDPVPITQVSADSGYYSGGIVNELVGQKDLEVIVPDSATACAMRRPCEPDPDPIEFTPVEGRNAYICSKGKLLTATKPEFRSGQWFTTYVAQTSCLDCPSASKCLKSPNAKKRNLIIGEFHDTLKQHLAQFSTPEGKALYYARGPAIETVFSFIRNTLNFNRWSLRGDEKVAAEATWLKAACLIRKLHTAKKALAAAA